MRLFGPTLRHSISANGGESTELSVATHANPSAKSASGWEPPIHVTSGRTSKQESKQLDLFGASSKTSPAICHWDSVRSPSAFKTWVSEFRRHCSQRRKSAHRTKGSGYSSSRWMTPLASDAKKKGSGSLARQVDPQSRWSFRHDSHTDPRTQDGWMYREDYNHRYLNPNFCEWLMGWEIGSTSVGKTVSELLGME